MSISLAYEGTLSRVRITGAMPGIADTFTRTVANGWGTSDSGSVWTATGGSASDFSVGSGVGVMALGSVNVYRQAVTAGSNVDSDVQVSVKTSALATGAEIIAELATRWVDGSNHYFARAAFATSGAVTLSVRTRIANSVAVLESHVTGLTHVAANRYTLRFSVEGTTLRAKLWQTGTAEPADWQASGTDNTLSAAGPIAVRSVLASGNTNVAPTVNFDNLTGRGIGVVERSTDQIRWTTVRGGAELDGTVGAAVLVDDYEFAPNTLNYYRVRRFAVSSQDSITPAMDRVWIKNLARPFLNRPVEVNDWTDPVHESRSAAFPIIGRSKPIGLSDVMLAKKYELFILAHTVADAEELVTCLASGEPVLIHLPDVDCPVPGGYGVVGNVVPQRTTRAGPRRIVKLPITECAAPGPDVVGATMTWQTVIATYASWTAEIADNTDWQALLDGIADPGDVVVD